MHLRLGTAPQGALSFGTALEMTRTEFYRSPPRARGALELLGSSRLDSAEVDILVHTVVCVGYAAITRNRGSDALIFHAGVRHDVCATPAI